MTDTKRNVNAILSWSSNPQDEISDLTGYVGKGDFVGGGAFGDVYRGVWQNVSASHMRSTELPEIAIKVMRVPPLRDEREKAKRLKKLKREVKVWQSLLHSNILPLIGLAFIDCDLNLPCMISMWMGNGTVKAYLKAFPGASKLAILVDVSEGLSYLHNFEPKVVHGDLKADNILVDINGKIYLADFGLSRMMDDDMLWETSATHAGGTVRWTAPELISGDEAAVTQEADVYAYAMTSYEIITGQIPFAYLRNDAAVVAAVLVRDQRPERPVVDLITDALWFLWQACWNSEPGNRPSAADLVSSMRKAAQHDTDSLFNVLRFETRNPSASLAFSADGQVLACGLSGSGGFLYNAYTGEAIDYPWMNHPAMSFNAVAFSLDGDTIVATDSNLGAWVWQHLSIHIGDTQYMDSLLCVRHNQRLLPMVSFFKSNGSFLYCGEEGSVTIYGDGGKAWSIALDRMHHEYLTSAAVSDDGVYLACCSNMGNFQLYHLENGVLLYNLADDKRTVAPEGLTFCCLSPAYDSVQGCRVLLCVDIPIADPVIWTFELADSKSKLLFQKETSLRTQDNGFISGAFSPDGHWLVTGCENGMVQAWETITGRELVPPLAAHTESVTSVAVSPDGKRVASSSLDNTVAIWDTSTITRALE